MHIAIIAASLTSGGAERVLTQLAGHWAQKGHRVSIVTFETSGTLPFYPLESQIELIQLNQSTNDYSHSLPRRLGHILKRLFCLRKAIKGLNPDMIVSFIDVINIITLLACKGLKIPVVVSERIDPKYHPLPKLYKWLRLKTYPWANKIVVQTQSAASYFPEKIAAHIKIIPNAVLKAACTKESQPLVKNLVTVGRLSAQKDHPTLIHSFAQLIKHYPDLTLTIYGEGPEYRNLKTLIQNLNLQDKIHLPGTTKDIPQALLKADLFIFPSLYEGFPNALCEAMAHGLPVIASNCTGNIDVVRDGIDGRLFPVGDVAALTAAIMELINDHDQRKTLSQKAQEISARFSSEQIYALWDEIVKPATE